MIPYIKPLAKDEEITFTDKAKVPILTYHDIETNIEVDITCQNPVSYYNTELVKECVQFPHVADLILLAKKVFKQL